LVLATTATQIRDGQEQSSGLRLYAGNDAGIGAKATAAGNQVAIRC
jgi:hypothetical protein